MRAGANPLGVVLDERTGSGSPSIRGLVRAPSTLEPAPPRGRGLAHPRRGAALALIACAAALLGGCSAKQAAPARGRSRGLSDAQESEIGRRADREIGENSPLYTEKPSLTEYVTGVGSKLAARSDRPDLSYRFAIVDSSVVNAFSLPGGRVYIDRGLLEHMTSEDELAAVLAHEVAHVAARHAAQQISKVFAPQLRELGPSLAADAANAARLDPITKLALTLAFHGYPADYERQADELGAAYAERAGYSSRGAEELRSMIEALARDEPRLVEAWLASHPQSSKRTSRSGSEPGSSGPRAFDPAGARKAREAYLEQIDGLPLGPVNEFGFVAGNRYVSRTHGFSIEIPEGFGARLGSGEKAVTLSRESDGLRVEVLSQSKIRPGTAGDIARDSLRFALQEGLTPTADVMRAVIPAGTAAVVRLEGADSRGRRVSVRKLFLTRLDRQIVVSFIAPAERTEETERMFQELTGSIHYLEPEELSETAQLRLALYRARPGDTWSSIAEQVIGEGASPARLAAYNGRTEGEGPEPDLLIKYPSKGAPSATR